MTTKDKIIEEHIHWKFNITVFILIAILFFSIGWNNNHYDKVINDLPKRFCENVTYNETEPILEQVTCECAKEDSDYYRKWHGYCLMWCGNITGYRNVTKIKEVCEIK